MQQSTNYQSNNQQETFNNNLPGPGHPAYMPSQNSHASHGTNIQAQSNRSRSDKAPSRKDNSNNKQNRAVVKADFTVIRKILDECKGDFENIVTSNGLQIKFFEEAIYAQQLIEANYNNTRDKSYSLASASPDSIRNALILVANSGLTLNPQLKLAYLVPRWNSKAGVLECHLEPSYKGLRRIGIDSGAIDSVTAELVYDTDQFEWADKFTKPVHIFDPFKSARGKLRGGYCLARRPDGSFICSPVTLEMLTKVQGLSKGSIWGVWFEQMAIKTIIRQGFKDWPIGGTNPQMVARAEALQSYINHNDKHSAEIQHDSSNSNNELTYC